MEVSCQLQAQLVLPPGSIGNWAGPRDSLNILEKRETSSCCWKHKHESLPITQPSHYTNYATPALLTLVPVPIQVANMAGYELHCTLIMTTLTSHYNPFPFPH